VKHATKLGYALRRLEEYKRETQENLTTKVITVQEALSLFLFGWFLSMLTESVNLQPKQEDKVEEDRMNWFFEEYCEASSPSLGQTLSLDDLHKAKTALAKANVPMTYVECSSNPIPVQEKTMIDIDDDFDFDRNMTEAERTRKFFINDLEIAEENKASKLRKHYGLEDDDSPRTFEDFISRIVTGKYAVSPHQVQYINTPGYFSMYNACNWLRWRNDGKLEEDHVGFDKAKTALKKATTSAERQIRVAPLENLPNIVEEFENTTFH
jgi:hypothetical protein